MVEIILSIVIIILCGLLVWREYQNAKERGRFINAIIAKTPEQYRDLETVTEEVVEPKLPADLVPQEELDQDSWEKAVTNV